MYLLVYSWIFVGTTIKLYVPLVGFRTVAVPFTSLKWIIMIYIVLGVASFITWLVGTVLYNIAFFCATTSPGLYSYVFFLVVIYWLAFAVVGVYMIQFLFGTRIGTVLRESTRDVTLGEAEISVFNAKFASYDPEEERKMKSEDFPQFLRDLGIFVPEEEIETLLQTFDIDGDEMLHYEPMLTWFKKYLEEREDDILDDNPEDIPDDPEELAIYNAEKKRRLEEKREQRKQKKA